jgi:hypothetical protein
MQSLALWWDEHPEVPRATLLDSAMAFCWLGLGRIRDGERATGIGVPERRGAA